MDELSLKLFGSATANVAQDTKRSDAPQREETLTRRGHGPTSVDL